MALLEAGGYSSLRKSRHNSMLILRAASQLNLNCDEEKEDKEDAEEATQELLEHHDRREEFRKELNKKNTSNKESLVIWLSALYGKLLIVIGMGFPIAQGLSPDLPLIYYNSFYLYLYFGSILFVIFAYVSLLSSFTMQLQNFMLFMRELTLYVQPFIASMSRRLSEFRENLRFENETPVAEEEVVEEINNEGSTESYESDFTTTKSSSLQSLKEDIEKGSDVGKKSKFVYTEKAGHGSMYLKMGTIVFGIGSMIYSGLEFGHYFELRPECSDILMAVTPASRMVFTFIQMYFVFMNSRISISRHTTIARFGFMHMVATNLCIWLNVLVEETKHTIHHVTHSAHESHHPESNHDYMNGNEMMANSQHHSIASSHFNASHENSSFADTADAEVFLHSTTAFPYTLKLTEGLFAKLSDTHSIIKRASGVQAECQNFNLMGNMVSSAAPLLYPCTIEYSLLCASVIYTMWKNVLTAKQRKSTRNQNEISQFIAKKVRHLYSVDCGRASRGLFMGIFTLVLTLISLILFYVLVSNPDFKIYGIVSAYSSEILIYTIGIVTTVVGMRQMRRLAFHKEEEIDLDNILLVVAQGGVYMFTIFTLIGGYFSKESISTLSMLTAFLTLVQATMQTVYILEGSNRCCETNEQLEQKHGREMVTYMLVLNLAMWLFNTFQTSRAYLHTAQQEFYGIWAWTIISHVSMPLAIFYRFHATVCLGEIWKRAYKMSAEGESH